MRIILIFSLQTFFLLGVGQTKLFDKAEEGYVLGNFQEALAVIDQKINRTPEPGDFLLRALIYKELNLRSNAHDDFVQAITRDPNYLEAYYHFAHFLTDSHDYERAVSALSVMLEKVDQTETQGIFFRIDRLGDQRVEVESISGMEAQILMSRGLAFQGLGMFEKALTDFNAALFMDESADKYVNRANLFKSMKMKNEAIADLKKAVQLDSRYGLAWYNLFILDTSIELPSFLKSAPDFGPMLSARAVEAFESGEYQVAEKIFEQALKLYPEDDLLLTNSGRLDLRNGFYRAALRKFNQASKLNPARNELNYLIANAFFGLRQYASAVDAYEEYLRIEPSSSNIWFNNAMAYLEIKKYKEACNCLNQASLLGMTQAEPYLEKYCTKE